MRMAKIICAIFGCFAFGAVPSCTTPSLLAEQPSEPGFVPEATVVKLKSEIGGQQCDCSRWSDPYSFMTEMLGEPHRIVTSEMFIDHIWESRSAIVILKFDLKYDFCGISVFNKY
jgi:hypothetical protein